MQVFAQWLVSNKSRGHCQERLGEGVAVKVGLDKSKNVVTLGLLSLGLSGCVHHANHEHTQQPFASGQSGTKQFTLFGFSLRSQNPALLEDPSEWPDKPNEVQAQSQFTEYFPNLSERAENRQSVVLKEPLPLVSNPVSAQAAASESPATNPVPSTAEVTQTPGLVADTAKVPGSAKAPVNAPAAVVETAKLPITEPSPVQAPAAIPAISDTPPVAAQIPAQSAPVETPKQVVAVQQPARSGATPVTVTSTGLAAVSPVVVASLVQTAAAAPVVVTPPAQQTTVHSAQAPIVESVAAVTPQAQPTTAKPAQSITTELVTKESPTVASQNVPAVPPAVVQPVLAIPAIPDHPQTVENAVVQPIATQAPAVTSATASVKKAVDVPAAVAQPIQPMSPPPAAAVVTADSLPPALPAEEVLHAPTALVQTTSPVVAPSTPAAVPTPKPSLDVPAIPVEPLPVTTVATTEPPKAETPKIAVAERLEKSPTLAPSVAPEQIAMREKPAAPAIPPVENDPPAPATIAKAAQVEAPMPVTIQVPAIPQAPDASPEPSVTPVQSNTSATVTTPASQTPKPTDTSVSDPPPPGPAPEVEVPGIPALDPAPTLLDPKAAETATSDKQIERSSAPVLNDKLAQKPKNAVEPAHSDTGSSSREAGDQDRDMPAETPIPDIDRPVKTLTPLPDDSEEISQTRMIQRTAEGDLVFRLKVTNPLRYWKPPVLVRSTRQPLKTQETVESSAEPSRFQSLKTATVGLFRRDRRPQPEPVENTEVVATQQPVTAPPAAASVIAVEEPARQQVTTDPTTPPDAIVKASVEMPMADKPAPAVIQTQPPLLSANTSSEMPVADKPAPAVIQTQPPVLSVNTSSELPPIQFPKSYHSSVRKTANPWANHARPAVNPYVMRQGTTTTAVAQKPEQRPAAVVTQHDKSVVPTSMSVSTQPAETPKPAAEPARIAPQPETRPVTTSKTATSYQSPSFWTNSTKRLKSFLNGSDEIVPPAPKSLSPTPFKQDATGKLPKYGPKFPLNNG